VVSLPRASWTHAPPVATSERRLGCRTCWLTDLGPTAAQARYRGSCPGLRDGVFGATGFAAVQSGMSVWRSMPRTFRGSWSSRRACGFRCKDVRSKFRAIHPEPGRAIRRRSGWASVHLPKRRVERPRIVCVSSASSSKRWRHRFGPGGAYQLPYRRRACGPTRGFRSPSRSSNPISLLKACSRRGGDTARARRAVGC
jgi:hypothetical protein